MTHVKNRHHTKKGGKRKAVQEPYEALYQGPYGIHPLTHVGFQEGRHLHPRRLPTPRGGERTVSMRLLDVCKETVDNVQQVSGTLKRLEVGGLRLQKVPAGLVSNLDILRKLDLSENELRDTSFPESMVDLHNLIELRLNGNKLTKLPTCLKRLRNLCRLDLSNNHLESISGMDKLRKLKILVLDSNKLTSVIKEIVLLKHLEILRCNNNRLKDIPHEIRNLQSLGDIDISNNNLTVLNTDIFMLPNLDALNACQNNISKIPSFNVQLHNKHWIAVLDLSGNCLTKFPSHLLQMTLQMDVSFNKIKSMSWNCVKKLDPDINQELDISENPITYPPLAVCEGGLSSVSKFLQESQLDVKTYQGIKILVLGSQGSGKTSLVQSLVDQQARLTRKDDISSGINVYETNFNYDITDGRPNKQLRLCIWDFCGHPYYSYPHYVFYEEQAITLLTFNIATYKKDKFYELIGSWFDGMITKTNKLVVLLVATHCDLLNRDQVRSISNTVCEQLKCHMAEGTQMIQQRIKNIEEHPVISPTLSEQLKSYTYLLRSKLSVQTNVIVTSSSKYKGFDQLCSAIETLAFDRKLFPHVMRVLPTFWVEIETYLEDRGNSMIVPILKWTEYTEEVIGKFGMKHMLRDITKYLHETGKLIWFAHVHGFRDYVILRPSWLFDVLRQLYRHDAEEAITYATDEVFKSAGISELKFDRMKRDFVTDAILDTDFLRGLLLPYFHSVDGLNLSCNKVLDFLLNAFEIGYPVTKRPKDMSVTFRAVTEIEERETPRDKLPKKIVQFLIPWLRQNPESPEAIEKWSSIAFRRSLCVHFHFPRHIPTGLFELMCIRAHNEQFKLNFVAHWFNGIQAVHKDSSVRIMIDKLQDTKSRESVVKFSVRDNTPGEDEVSKSTMWGILVPLLTEFDDLLKFYTGLIVERFVECPYCNQPSFPGEWSTPKETQALTNKPCSGCRENVDSSHLVHPKTKTKVKYKYLIKSVNLPMKSSLISVDENAAAETQQ